MSRAGAVLMAILLGGCDQRSLVKTSIDFAYMCQSRGLTAPQCKRAADRTIDDTNGDWERIFREERSR